jgi:hypothetical protein
MKHNNFFKVIVSNKNTCTFCTKTHQNWNWGKDKTKSDWETIEIKIKRNEVQSSLL